MIPFLVVQHKDGNIGKSSYQIDNIYMDGNGGRIYSVSRIDHARWSRNMNGMYMKFKSTVEILEWLRGLKIDKNCVTENDTKHSLGIDLFDDRPVWLVEEAHAE